MKSMKIIFKERSLEVTLSFMDAATLGLIWFGKIKVGIMSHDGIGMKFTTMKMILGPGKNLDG